jgi:hypothetical protein
MDSWTEKSISETGQALNEAALHLESAWEWSKKTADKSSRSHHRLSKTGQQKDRPRHGMGGYGDRQEY